MNHKWSGLMWINDLRKLDEIIHEIYTIENGWDAVANLKDEKQAERIRQRIVFVDEPYREW